MNTLTYDGKRNRYIVGIKTAKALSASVTNESESIANVMGETFLSTKQGSLVLGLVLLLKTAKNADEIQKQRDSIALFFDKKEPAALIFDKSPNRKFYCLADGDLSFEEGLQPTVTLNMKVFDGKSHATFKRRFPAALNSKGVLEAIVTNTGTTAVPIDYYIKHNHENGYIGIVSNAGVVQVGNESETDKGILPSKILFDLSAKDNTLQGLATGGGTFTGDWNLDGDWYTERQDGRVFMAANKFGTIKNGWHGATKHQNLVDSNGDGIVNFTIDLRLHFLNLQMNTKGLMEFVLVDGVGKTFIGFSIDKGEMGSIARVRCHNGETSGTFDIDTNTANPFDIDHGQVTITKTGKDLVFNFFGQKVSYVVNTLADKVFTSFNLISAKHAETPESSKMWWERVRITKHYTDENADIPNRFPENSEVFLQGSTGKVYQDGLQIPDANGSIWFMAEPGDTKVEFYFSEFSYPVPSIVAEIEEAWL